MPRSMSTLVASSTKGAFATKATDYGETGGCVDGECREADDPEAVGGGGGCASCSVGDHHTAAGIAALGLYALAAAAGGRRRRSPR